MSLDLFKKILNGIRSMYQPWKLDGVSFATNNEPNLDDKFTKNLQIMTNMGFKYEHISDGKMITTELTDLHLIAHKTQDRFV